MTAIVWNRMVLCIQSRAASQGLKSSVEVFIKNDSFDPASLSPELAPHSAQRILKLIEELKDLSAPQTWICAEWIELQPSASESWKLELF